MKFESDGCTWFPDLWISHCCYDHDLAGYESVPDAQADAAFFTCIVEATPVFEPIAFFFGFIIVTGMILGRPIYRFIKGSIKK